MCVRGGGGVAVQPKGWCILWWCMYWSVAGDCGVGVLQARNEYMARMQQHLQADRPGTTPSRPLLYCARVAILASPCWCSCCAVRPRYQPSVLSGTDGYSFNDAVRQLIPRAGADMQHTTLQHTMPIMPPLHSLAQRTTWCVRFAAGEGCAALQTWTR